MSIYKVIQSPKAITEHDCHALIRGIVREAGAREWFIRLEMRNAKHDKFYHVGADADSYYVQYGRIGTAGRRVENHNQQSVSYKLFEKMAKGYQQTTFLQGVSAFPEVFEGKPLNPVDLHPFNDGNEHFVDLSYVSPMFKLVDKLVFENGRFKAFNMEGAFIMTVPSPVVEQYVCGGAS